MFVSPVVKVNETAPGFRMTVLIELEEKREGDMSGMDSESTDANGAGISALISISLISLISTEVIVMGDIGDEAASAINTVVALRPLDNESASPMTVGLNRRASAETDVAKTSAAVVTVLFLLDLYIEKIKIPIFLDIYTKIKSMTRYAMYYNYTSYIFP